MNLTKAHADYYAYKKTIGVTWIQGIYAAKDLKKPDINVLVNQHLNGIKRVGPDMDYAVANTLTILRSRRKREGEEAMVKFIAELSESGDPKRAAMCARWYNRIYKEQVARYERRVKELGGDLYLLKIV